MWCLHVCACLHIVHVHNRINSIFLLQVRFSGDTKLTSSHRSRFNSDPNTQIRRRHVEKLLGLRSPPRKAATSVTKVADNAAAQDSDCASESDTEVNTVGVKDSSMGQAEHFSQSNIPSLEIK